MVTARIARMMARFFVFFFSFTISVDSGEYSFVVMCEGSSSCILVLYLFFLCSLHVGACQRVLLCHRPPP